MVFGFGKKNKEENKEEENKDKKNNLANIIEEELKNKNYNIEKYKLFVFKLYKDNDFIYLPSTNLKYFEMIGNANDIKIINIKELDDDIIKIELSSPELYDRIKSAMSWLEKLAGFKI